MAEVKHKWTDFIGKTVTIRYENGTGVSGILDSVKSGWAMLKNVTITFVTGEMEVHPTFHVPLSDITTARIKVQGNAPKKPVPPSEKEPSDSKTEKDKQSSVEDTSPVPVGTTTESKRNIVKSEVIKLIKEHSAFVQKRMKDISLLNDLGFINDIENEKRIVGALHKCESLKHKIFQEGNTHFCTTCGYRFQEDLED